MVRRCGGSGLPDGIREISGGLDSASEIGGTFHLPYRQGDIEADEDLSVKRMGCVTKARQGMYSGQTQTCMYMSARSTLERKTGTREGSTWRMWSRRRRKAW